MDDSLKNLIEEIEAMGDNAILFPTQETVVQPTPSPPSQPSQPSVQKKREASVQTNVSGNGWIIKAPVDLPIVSWVDSGYQYNVQNSMNYGNVMIKLQVFDNNHPVHSCGLYINKDDKVYRALTNLTNELENLWVNKISGEPKQQGLIQTMVSIPAWRKPTMAAPVSAATSNNGGCGGPPRRKRAATARPRQNKRKP